MGKEYIASNDEKKLLWTLKQLLKTENQMTGKQTTYKELLSDLTDHYDKFNQYLNVFICQTTE